MPKQQFRIYSTWASYVDAYLMTVLNGEIPNTMQVIADELGDINGRALGLVIGDLRTRGMGKTARALHNAVHRFNADQYRAHSRYEGDEYWDKANEENAMQWLGPQESEK